MLGAFRLGIVVVVWEYVLYVGRSYSICSRMAVILQGTQVPRTTIDMVFKP